MSPIRRKILAACITASLLLHVAAIALIQHSSLWLTSSSSQKNQPWLSSIEKKAKDQILKEAFDPSNRSSSLEIASPQKEVFFTKPLKDAFLELETAEMPAEQISYKLFQAAFPQIELSALPSDFLPSFSFFPQQTLDLFQHLPKDLILPKPLENKTVPPQEPPPFAYEGALRPSLKSPTPKGEEPPTPVLVQETPLLQAKSLVDGPGLLKKDLPAPLPTLPILPTLAELETSSYSDSFDADLVFLPKEDGQGYLFALTLIPRPDLDLPKLKQHFVFLLNRSNSVQQERLQTTKAALLKSLEELLPDDTFNILAFDSKIEKFSPRPLSVSPASLEAAEQFLEKVSLGSFFSPADPYQPLLLTVPGKVQEDELYTAILLTDGESFAKKQLQKAILQDWTNYNAGRVALFPLLLDTDAQLSLLDTAAAFNKGKLFASNSRKGIKRKLLKMVRNLQHPIAKNMSCKAISRHKNSQVTLFPSNRQMPHLYLNQPFVLLGTTQTLEDFVLFVQGRTKEGWIHIKKTISFVNARKGSPSLKAEWALQGSYSLYEKYLQEENPSYLKEAAALLEPYDFQVALR